MCRQNISIMFNKICINEEMLRKYIPHIYIYIYIYISKYILFDFYVTSNKCDGVMKCSR